MSRGLGQNSKASFRDTTGGGGGGSVSRGAIASLPAAGTAGALYLPSDAPMIYEDNGTVQNPYGPLYPLTKPPTSGWSWLNQGSAAVDTTKGGIYLSGTALGAQLRSYVRTVPTAPYTIDALVIAPTAVNDGSNSAWGVCWTDGTLYVIVQCWHSNGRLYGGYKFNSVSSYNSAYTADIADWNSGPLFLRMADDNTNRVLSTSHDGVHYRQLHSVGRTDFLTATQVGIFILPNVTAVLTDAWLLSWREF